MSEKQPKLKFEEDKERTATRSPPKKSKVEQSKTQKQKLKLDADKAAEKAQHLRFGKAEITPDEASRMTKQQKRAMYAAAAARSAAHREIDQYEDDNVGTQALNEGVKSKEAVSDFSKNRYARKLKKESQDAGQEGCQNRKIFPAEADCGTRCRRILHRRGRLQLALPMAAETGHPAELLCRRPFGHSGADRRRQSGIQWHHCCEVWHGTGHRQRKIGGQYRSQRHCQFCKKQRARSLIVGVFLLLLLLVMSAFSSCSILFSGTTQVSGQTIYTAEDRDIRGAETDYKKLEKELDKKIKRTPPTTPATTSTSITFDPIEHDPWQLTSFSRLSMTITPGQKCRAS